VALCGVQQASTSPVLKSSKEEKGEMDVGRREQIKIFQETQIFYFRNNPDNYE
jgi:hypothetical protein